MIKKFWEQCSQNYAHLKSNWELKIGSRRLNHFYKSFLRFVNFKDKIILDYGCGAGYLGKILFDKYGLKKYIGIDIAERSLIKARQILEGYNTEFHLTPKTFKNIEADIFISLACIQHFPDEEYLYNFLKNVNKSGISTLILQIRYGEETVFNNAYKIKKDFGMACVTNEEYIDERLRRYKLINVSGKGISGYQYLIWGLNG